MKALVWKGGDALDYENVGEPQPGGDEAVLTVRLAGICGSDLHGYRGHPGPRVPPLVLGHEVVGELGGRRFTLYPLIGCGECERCLMGEENMCARWRLVGMHRQGVFAEEIAVPRSTLVELPPDLPAERAVLCEPLACAVAALAGAPLGTGQRVAVLGCGPIGLLVGQLAASRGAEVEAVDPLAARRELALRLGAHRAVPDAGELEQGACDLVVDAAGFAPTWAGALALVRAGGQIVVLGLGDAEGPFPMAALVRRSVRLRGQFAYTRDEFAEALELLGGSELDLDWCSTQPLSEGAEAFARLVREPERYAKILLAPGG